MNFKYGISLMLPIALDTVMPYWSSDVDFVYLLRLLMIFILCTPRFMHRQCLAPIFVVRRVTLICKSSFVYTRYHRKWGKFTHELFTVMKDAGAI